MSRFPNKYRIPSRSRRRTRSVPARRCLAALTAAVLASGCSSFRTEWGAPVRPESGLLKEGTTRMETVARELGPPAQVTALPDGCAFLYEYSAIDEFQVGLSADFPVLRWLKLVHAFNHLDQDTLLLTFDDLGVLRSQGDKAWRETLGGGNAAQFLFVSLSLTDPELRRQRADQHRWGRYLLQPVPVLLNENQNLRTGENGLQQQRIAPKFAGQQTLEMAKPMTKKTKFGRRCLE